MGTEVDNGSNSHLAKDDSDLKHLEQDYIRLKDEAQRLISERIQLENEMANIKKRASRLNEEVRILKNPPLIVGHLQDVLDEERAIVRSSNGTVFQVSINQRLSKDKLRPGTRVALNQDTLSVIEVLHDAWDPMVSGAEMIEAPNISYDSVGGLDEQILQVREAIELPLEKPELFRKVGIQPQKEYSLLDHRGVERQC